MLPCQACHRFQELLKFQECPRFQVLLKFQAHPKSQECLRYQVCPKFQVHLKSPECLKSPESQALTVTCPTLTQWLTQLLVARSKDSWARLDSVARKMLPSQACPRFQALLKFQECPRFQECLKFQAPHKFQACLRYQECPKFQVHPRSQECLKSLEFLKFQESQALMARYLTLTQWPTQLQQARWAALWARSVWAKRKVPQETSL